MKVIAMSRKGTHKSENEDRIVVGKTVMSDGMFCTEERVDLLAVADGVGGRNAGAVASNFVANRVCTASEWTEAGFGAINADLLLQSNRIPERNGMATTLSGVSFANGTARLFSVGNTRVYLLQSGKYFKQLTVDDTVVQHLLALKKLTVEEAKTFERRNEITACFGGGDPNLFKIRVKEMERPSVPMVLTSDGIHDYLSLDEMESLVEEYGLCEAMCAAMIDRARENGSSDDASIVVCEG